MNKFFIISVMAFLTTLGQSFGQDISQLKVPSLIVNRFQQDYPEARDVEWERKDSLYEVDFELGWINNDHEIRYDAEGKVVWHKKEISKGDLPQEVKDRLSADYKFYWIKDVKEIEENNQIIYTLEAKSLTREWKLTLDKEGNILDKVAD